MQKGDCGNFQGLILFLGIQGLNYDYKQQKRKQITEANASACLLLVTALKTLNLVATKGVKRFVFFQGPEIVYLI